MGDAGKIDSARGSIDSYDALIGQLVTAAGDDAASAHQSCEMQRMTSFVAATLVASAVFSAVGRGREIESRPELLNSSGTTRDLTACANPHDDGPIDAGADAS
jgi:hypothetical protein